MPNGLRTGSAASPSAARPINMHAIAKSRHIGTLLLSEHRLLNPSARPHTCRGHQYICPAGPVATTHASVIKVCSANGVGGLRYGLPVIPELHVAPTIVPWRLVPEESVSVSAPASSQWYRPSVVRAVAAVSTLRHHGPSWKSALRRSWRQRGRAQAFHSGCPAGTNADFY